MRNGVLAALVTAAAAAALAILAINVTGTYGLMLFVALPVFVGYAPAALLASGPALTFGRCLLVASLAALLTAHGFLLMGSEGLICMAMAMPLAAPLIMLGAKLAHVLFHEQRLPHSREGLLLVAALIATGIAVEPSLHRGPARVYLAEDSIDMRATPEEVWATIVTLGEIAPPDDLFFRSGVACPQKTRIVQASHGGTRVCTMSTGLMLERIDAWEPGRRLSWRALSTPPPMTELNPFGEVDAPHLHGFYRNVRGEFFLERAGGVTRVTRRTWYEHDLYPSAYWRIWCDIGASKIHRLVLEHVRDETGRRRGGRKT